MASIPYLEKGRFVSSVLKKLNVVATNAAGILFYLALAFIQLKASLHADLYARIVLWLLLVQSGLVIGFFLVRRFSTASTLNPWHIFIAYVGFFSPLFIRINTVNHSNFWFPGLTIQLIGTFLTLYGSLSLGRSWSILPANRGIKTQGMYQYVRHPIYASYQIFTLGVLISTPSLYNLAIASLFTVSQIIRLNIEEKILISDPVYLQYISKVRWKIIPFVY